MCCDRCCVTVKNAYMPNRHLLTATGASLGRD